MYKEKPFSVNHRITNIYTLNQYFHAKSIQQSKYMYIYKLLLAEIMNKNFHFLTTYTHCVYTILVTLFAILVTLTLDSIYNNDYLIISK